MRKVQNKQTVRISLITSETDTLTTAAGGNVGIIDTNVSLAALSTNQTGALRSALVNIIDIAVGWITSLLF